MNKRSNIIRKRADELPRASRTELDRMAALGEPDYSDIPEVTDEEFAAMAAARRKRLAADKKIGKKPVTIRLDEDLLTYFRALGGGYQTRINDALRSYVALRPDPSDAEALVERATEDLRRASELLAAKRKRD